MKHFLPLSAYFVTSLYSSNACRAAVRSDCFCSSFAFSFSMLAADVESVEEEAEEPVEAVEQQQEIIKIRNQFVYYQLQRKKNKFTCSSKKKEELKKGIS